MNLFERARRAAGGLFSGRVASSRSFRNATRGRLRPGAKAPASSATGHRDRASLDGLIVDCEALARDNHLVRAILATQRDVVVGHAPAIEVQSDDAGWNADVEARFRAWADGHDPDAGAADVFGQLSFWELAADVVTRWETSGGALRHFVKAAGRPLAVELIEVYRLRNPRSGPDTLNRKGGVELGEDGRPVAFHLADWNESGSYLRESETRRLDARAAALMNSPRLLAAGQWRAEPGLSSVVDRLEVLDRATEAAFAAYETAAGIALALMRDPVRSSGDIEADLAAGMVEQGIHDDTDDAIAEGVWRMGMLLDLNAGDDVKQISAEHPSTPFQEAFWSELQAICAAIDLPLELTHYRYIRNFHASRSAIATAWRRIQARQEALRRAFITPCYVAWLRGEIADGRVAFRDDWRKHTVRLSTMPILDPKVEAEASKMLLAAGLSLHETELARFGTTDRAAFIQRREAELEDERRLGITAGADPVQTTVSEQDAGGDEDPAAAAGENDE